MSSTGKETTVPSSAAAAVLTPSNEMPKGSQKVEELDFNAYFGRPITVEDLVHGMNHMGFQASSIGEAVRIINDMVRAIANFMSSYCIFFCRKTGMMFQVADYSVEGVARSGNW